MARDRPSLTVAVPTALTVACVGLGAPAALLIGVISPALWFAAPLWVALCLAAFAFDSLIGPVLSKAVLRVDAPQVVGVGETFAVRAAVTTGGRGRPRDAALALAVDARLADTGRLDAPLRANDMGIGADFDLSGLRRGPAALKRAWVSWTGPLGLARKQRAFAIDQSVAIAPSIRAVREEGVKLFARDAQIGQRLNARLGEGSEFESLVRFMPGLDRRSIDWKQSARHTDLLAKQFETERDNRIVLAVDSGRMMSDPLFIGGGANQSRLDRAVSAALTLGYVALRMDDRVSLASFAARPQVASREFARLADFAALRRAAADIDYAAEETNYTLGLASIGAALKRRALIVVFTEFADATSAELMLGAVQRLIAKHLLMFVVTADTELEAVAARIPASAADVAGATVAAELLRDRRVVLTRLRRMGVQVVETPADSLSTAVLSQYVRIKRQGLI